MRNTTTAKTTTPAPLGEGGGVGPGALGGPGEGVGGVGGGGGVAGPLSLWILCIPIVGLDLHLSMAVGHFFCIFGSLAVGIANDSAHIQ